MALSTFFGILTYLYFVVLSLGDVALVVLTVSGAIFPFWFRGLLTDGTFNVENKSEVFKRFFNFHIKILKFSFIVFIAIKIFVPPIDKMKYIISAPAAIYVYQNSDMNVTEKFVEIFDKSYRILDKKLEKTLLETNK